MRIAAAAAALAACCACLAIAQEPRLISVYVDLSADRCRTSGGLVLRSTTLLSRSPVRRPVRTRFLPSCFSIRAPACWGSRSRRLPDACRGPCSRPTDSSWGTFSPKVVFSRTTLTSEDAASRAAREVSQKQVGQGGPSPLWDALYKRVCRCRRPPAFARSSSSQTHGPAATTVAMPMFTISSRIREPQSWLWLSATMRCQENSNMQAIGRNDALRRLTDQTAGFYMELTKANGPPPYQLLVESLRNLRHRCRLEVERPSGLNTVYRLSLTSAGVPVRAPIPGAGPLKHCRGLRRYIFDPRVFFDGYPLQPVDHTRSGDGEEGCAVNSG